MFLWQSITEKHGSRILVWSVLRWRQRPEDIKIWFVAVAIHVVRSYKPQSNDCKIYMEKRFARHSTKKLFEIHTAYQTHARYISIIARPFHFNLIIQLRIYISQGGWRMGAWMRVIPSYQRNTFPLHGSCNFGFHSRCSWLILARIPTWECTRYRKICNNARYGQSIF